jgi:hypothetical protein
MLVTKWLFARLAVSATSLACCRAASVRRCARISDISSPVWRRVSSCATRRLSCASTSSHAATPPITTSTKNACQ